LQAVVMSQSSINPPPSSQNKPQHRQAAYEQALASVLSSISDSDSSSKGTVLDISDGAALALLLLAQQHERCGPIVSLEVSVRCQ
jgi:tRNA1(Val) A37 N6-methylase TrmN6